VRRALVILATLWTASATGAVVKVPAKMGLVIDVPGVKGPAVVRFASEPVLCRQDRRGVTFEVAHKNPHSPYLLYEIAPQKTGGCTPGRLTAGKSGLARAKAHSVPAFKPDWDAWKEADYLMIAPRAWLPALQPLITHRQGLGHRVVAVGVEDIYSRHKGGNPTPDAIRDFVGELVERTAGKLRFLLLASDITEKYKPSAEAVAPVAAHYKRKMLYGKGLYRGTSQYPTDDEYAQAGRNGRLAVGRIPAQTREQLAAVVRKIVRYETQPAEGEWRRRLAVFTGPARYGKFADNLVETTARHLLDTVVPYDYDLSFLFAKLDSDYAYPPAGLSRKLVDTLDRGALIAGYVGHGQIHAFDRIFFRGRLHHIGSVKEADAMAIKTGNPFFVSLACLTGAFDRRGERAIAEAMAINEGGPVAVLAGSRVVHPYANGMYAQALIDKFFTSRPRTVGEGVVAMKARAAAYRNFMVEAWLKTDGAALLAEHEGLYNLLGDPATRLRYPDPVAITIARPRVRRGATLSVTIDSPGGDAKVTVETQRTTIRGTLVPYDRIRKMEAAQAQQTMAANYRLAMDKVVATTHHALAAGPVTLKLTAPKAPGAYAVKVLLTGPGRTAAGHVRFHVTNH